MNPASLLLAASLLWACGSPTGPLAQAGAGEPMHFTSSGVSLSGIVYLPEGKGPFPGVVLVHGSGRVRAVDHLALTLQFVERGFAVLSYDKRGVGGSGGEYRGVGPLNSDSMIRVLAGDAVAGLEALARDRRIDRRRLGLAGASQAGWIIPNAATRFPVAFAVILSGPLVTVGQEIHYSNVFEATDRPLVGVDSILGAYAGPAGYDPVPDVRHMNGAVYWIWGEKDRSIPALRSAAIGRDLIGELRRGTWRTVTLPAGDHGLMDATTGRSLPFWPAVFDWLSTVLQ